METYKVTYRGGHPDLPKSKAGGVRLLLTPEAFVLNPTIGSEKFWKALTIPYADVNSVQIVARVVSTFESLAGGLNSRQLNQDNNIHIDYALGSGNRVLLRLEMLSGVTVMGQAKRCREFEDRLRALGITGKFKQAAAGRLSLDDRIPVVNQFKSVVDGSPYALTRDDDSDAEIYKAIGTQRSYRELCEAMIAVSSNLATNLLIDRLGAERVFETMRSYGAEGMLVRRGVEDDKAFERGLNNTATARGFHAILAAIGRREVVSADASAEMIAILKRQTFRNGIPAGLPPEMAVAHKTGTITKVHHDGGIVFATRPYVLVVLTRGFADEKSSDALIAGVSKLVYDTVK